MVVLLMYTFEYENEDEDINDISNSVIDLCNKREYDDADLVCERLRPEYPDMVDGLDRQAMVYEARGNKEKALEYYTKTLDFMKKTPDDFDCDRVESKIEKLNN